MYAVQLILDSTLASPIALPVVWLARKGAGANATGSCHPSQLSSFLPVRMRERTAQSKCCQPYINRGFSDVVRKRGVPRVRG